MKNPICIDCGRRIHYDEAVAVQLNSKTAYICQACARYALVSIRNPLPSSVRVDKWRKELRDTESRINIVREDVTKSMFNLTKKDRRELPGIDGVLGYLDNTLVRILENLSGSVRTSGTLAFELETKKRNPLHICPHCGARIYSVGVPRFCPRCKKTWRERNPMRTYEVVYDFTTDAEKKFLKSIARKYAKSRPPVTASFLGDEVIFRTSQKPPLNQLMYEVGEARRKRFPGIFITGMKWNPIRYVDGWQYGRRGKIYPRREGALKQMRAIHYARGRRNPVKKTFARLPFGGLELLLVFPAIIGLVNWLEKKE